MGTTTTRGNRVRAVLSAGVLTAAATSALAACGGGVDPDEEDQVQTTHVYCADDTGKVVDPELCDDDDGGGGGLFFFYMGGFGGHSYQPGQVIPQQYRSTSGGTTRVRTADATARANAGLPRTGPVANGTRIAGGIGTGKAGGAGAKPGGIGKPGSAGG